MARRSGWLVLGLLLLTACDKPAEPVPDIVIEVPTPTARPVDGPNAFEAYARLAERAVQSAPVGLDVRDTDGTRTKVLRELGPVLDDLAQATNSSCAFHYTVVGPFDPKPHHLGWLQISRALTWRIERAISNGEFDAASQWAIVAMVFGADLCGGDVSDASLGYGVIDGARAAVAPYLASLSPAALDSFAIGTARALQRMPDPAVTLQNESVRMLAAVRALQRATSEGDFEGFALHNESREAADRLAKATPIERNAFLQSLVEEQVQVAAQLNRIATVPGAKRGPLEIGLEGDERKIALQFFSAGEPWLSVRDRLIARTRLLYGTAKLLAASRSDGVAPTDLDHLDVVLRTDPYTGMEFGYLPLGREFIVYSYGIDGKDDRGDTDSTRTHPDLLLEGN